MRDLVDRHHPLGRRRHRRLQHPVRGQPARRPAGRDRDEPAGLPFLARWRRKATGFPIAKIAAKVAIGYTLDEIPNDITIRADGQSTPAAFEPTLDYVVVKVPRFAFEKFPGADHELTTHMKSVGEAMAIGRNFTEALQKALRSLESKDAPFDWHAGVGRPGQGRAARGDQGPARRPAQEGHGRAARRRDRGRGLRGDPHRPVVRRPAAADQRGRRRGDRVPPS